MKQIIQLTLPWPHRALSPNARVNLMQKARIFKREKYATMMLTKAALQKVGIEKVTVKGGLPDKKWRGGRVNIELICISAQTARPFLTALLKACRSTTTLSPSKNRTGFKLKIPVISSSISPGNRAWAAEA